MRKFIFFTTIICFSYLIFGCTNLNLDKYWNELKFTDISSKMEFSNGDIIKGDFSAPTKIGNATLTYTPLNKNITLKDNLFKISPIILNDQLIRIEATLNINGLSFNKEYELVLKKTPVYRITLPSEYSISNLNSIPNIKINEASFYFLQGQNLDITLPNTENKKVYLVENNKSSTKKEITSEITNNVYKFNPSNNINDFTITTEDITFKLTAVFEDGERATLKETHIINSEYVLPPAFKDGYKFIKWVLKDNPDIEVSKITFDKDYVIKPIFEKGYKLQYDLDGGSLDEEIPSGFANNEEYNLPVPKKDGYTFIKWIDIETNEEVSKITFNKDYSIKAIYQRSNFYVVEFDYNGGVDSSGNKSRPAEEINANTYIESLPTLTHPDTTVEFVGWYNNLHKISFPYKVEKSETLKAIFKKIIYYDITYDYNGGKDSEGNTSRPNQKLKANTKIENLPDLIHPNTALTFVGWFDSKGKISFPYEVNDDETIRAVFKKEIKVYFDLNGGEINGSGNYDDDKKHYVGDKIISLPTPVKTNFNFKEWTVNNKKIAFPYTLPDNTDITFKAEYIKGLDAEIPDGYYNEIEGKEDEALILALQTILKRMRGISYADVRYALEKTDEDPDNPGYVLGMYDRKYYKNKWTGGDPWNREHVWPNSKLGVGRVKANQINQASDLHNLRACEKNIN